MGRGCRVTGAAADAHGLLPFTDLQLFNAGFFQQLNQFFDLANIHVLTIQLFKGGGQRQLVPMIPREIDTDDSVIGLREFLHRGPSVVFGPIIHQNQFVFVTYCALRCGTYTSMKFAQTVLFVVARHNNGKRKPANLWYLLSHHTQFFTPPTIWAPLQRRWLIFGKKGWASLP